MDRKMSYLTFLQITPIFLPHFPAKYFALPGDVGWPVPLAEEHVASVGMDDNGTRSLEVLEQRPPVFVVLGGEDVEGSLPRVDVVEVVARPVHGQPLHPLVLTSEDILP